MKISLLVDICYASNRIMHYLTMGDYGLAMCFLNLELRSKGYNKKKYLVTSDDMRELSSIVC